MAIGTYVPAAWALAQSAEDTLAALEACAALELDRARLACFDATLAERATGARTAAGEPAAGEPAAGGPAADEPAAGGPAAGGPAADEPAAGGSATSEAAARSSSASDAGPRDAAGAAPARRAAPPAPSAQAQDGREVVTIVETRLRPRPAFIADDGRVFTRTSGRLNMLPEVPFEAVIERGALGSSFLELPPGHGPRIRVTVSN